MTKKQVKEAIRKAVKSGNWMIRTDNNGYSYKGTFKWKPLGQWTEAPDWDPTPECGHGLHGQTLEYGGFITKGNRLLFCDIHPESPVVPIDGNKVKVKKARILAINDLSMLKNQEFKGSLDLADTPIEQIPKGLKVGGNLNLHYTPIKKLPEDLKVGGDLDLSNTPIEQLPKSLKVEGIIYTDFF